MKRIRRCLLMFAALVVGIAGAPLLSGNAAAAAPTTSYLSTRICEDYNTGDDLRQLSVCVSIWVNDTPGQSRGVVDMHTYKLSQGQRVGDSVSKSITLNYAAFVPNTAPTRIDYGADEPNKCRLNSASGPVNSCSVPNTSRVTFYSTAFNGIAQSYEHCVNRVSWRDDRGQAHYLDTDTPSYPYTLPVCAYL